MMTAPVKRMWASVFLLVGLTGCQGPNGAADRHLRDAPRVDVSVPMMSGECKDQAAHRYNTQPERVDLQGFDAFQGSYEMRGITPRHERFTCNFDETGQFLHLSMR